MKFILSITGILLLGTGLAGCDNTSSKVAPKTATVSASATTATTVAKPNSGKTYAAGVPTSYVPFGYLDERGKPTGFDIDILNAIADDQKINFDQIPGVHNTFYTQVLANKEQLGSGGLTYNEERARTYAVSDPYRTTKNVLVYVRPELNLKELKDLAGLRAGVISRNSSQEKHIRDANVPVKEVISYNTPYLAIQSLLLNNSDVAVLNADVVATVIKSLTNQKFLVVPYAVNGEIGQDLIFIMNRNETELVNKVNAGLKNIRNNGVYGRISEKWFGNETNIPASPSSASTPAATSVTK